MIIIIINSSLIIKKDFNCLFDFNFIIIHFLGQNFNLIYSLKYFSGLIKSIKDFKPIDY
jgi:hypothetical protein